MDWDCGFSTNSPEFLLFGDEEMEELRSEKTVTTSKSPEEIEKQIVDESLSPLERASLLLRTGQDVQKVYTMTQLPVLLETQREDTLSKIIPKICESLPTASSEIQVAAGRSVGVVVTRNLVPIHIFTSAFLPLVIRLVNSRDAAVSSVWLEALLDSIPALSKDIIRRNVLSLATARSQLSQTVSSRKSGCLIFGAITQKFEPFWLKREVFPQVRSLCQDVDSEVRVTMCSQLPLFAKHMSPDLAKSCVFPELTELINDEESSVRVAALEAMADVVPHMSSTAVTVMVVPLVQRVCEQSLSSGRGCLTGVARLLGKLSHQLRDVMTSDLRDWFVQFYCRLSKLDEPITEGRPQSSLSLAMPASTVNGMLTECRHLCAYNFPAMLMMVGAGGYQLQLSTTLQELASDECPHVRHTVASSYHEVVRLLGDKSMSAVGIYQKLLSNKSVEVLQALSSHLPETLKGFAVSANLSPDTKHPGLPELIGPLLSAEGVASRCLQWRLHRELIAGFSSLVLCLTSDQLYNKIVPVLIRNITGKVVRPVKLASSHSLVVITRSLRKSEQRTAICDRLIKECAHSEVCHDRLLFLDVCDIVLAVFSRAFFKEHFFTPALELGNDPVVNVRLRVCSMLPALKTTLKLPGDRVLLRDLDDMVRQLLSRERDVDTSQAIRTAVLELDRIQIAMETLTRRTFFEADLIDQQRETEERQLLQVAEEREREREGGKKVGSAKGSPVVQRGLPGKKLKAIRTSSVPATSPNVSSSHRAGSISTITPLSITSSPLPAHSPNTLRKTLTVPKPKGPASKSSSPPSIHRSHSGISMSRCDGFPVENAVGTALPRSMPGSPHAGVKHSRPKTSNTTSHSANNSPNSGLKSAVSKAAREQSGVSRRRPPHAGSLKGVKRT